MPNGHSRLLPWHDGFPRADPSAALIHYVPLPHLPRDLCAWERAEGVQDTSLCLLRNQHQPGCINLLPRRIFPLSAEVLNNNDL